MKAKLVYCSLMTRVVVDDDATDEQITELAKDRLINTIRTSLGDNIEDIVDDEEFPFDPDFDVIRD